MDPKLGWEDLSDEMKELLEHRKEIKSWIANINQKIFELETSYLEEHNSLGNVIKGWDPDGRTLPIKRTINDEKDRLFSNSSYEIWNNMKSHEQEVVEKKLANSKFDPATPSASKSSTKNKKMKKSVGGVIGGTLEDNWDHPIDY